MRGGASTNEKKGEKQELFFLCSVAAAPMNPAQGVIPAKAH